MSGRAIVFIATIGCAALGASSASACDMTQSMTDPTCANEGFPNVFNNPPPAFNNPAPGYSPYAGPAYAYGVLGLLEGAHPTMIYPGQPVICRQGLDCPGDATEPPRPAEARAYRHSRVSRSHHEHRPTQAASQ